LEGSQTRTDHAQENYGRAKETHAHTQTLWEKEIRRARKENFKSQSVVVKLQEELKTARSTVKSAEADLDRERERSSQREQEAFAARYQLVGVQEELAQMHERIKLVEQERDALRTIAANEEIARIAAEGRIPLPTLPEDDEFASPKKSPKRLELVSITSSAASEEELEDMKMRLQWEKRRADRAHDRVEFLELECRSNCCSSRPSPSVEPPANSSAIRIPPSNTVFIPAEGVFRTVSPPPEGQSWISASKQMPLPVVPPQPAQSRETLSYARTPSCEPPSQAVAPDANTSLLSLLAPQSPHTTPEPPTHTAAPSPPPPSSQQIFHTISTTTTIPLASPADDTAPRAGISPTMSREQALAQIRERRGRARSLANGTMTPKKPVVPTERESRRDISAPASAAAGLKTGPVRGRSTVRA
jgi:hypothetical protein